MDNPPWWTRHEATMHALKGHYGHWRDGKSRPVVYPAGEVRDATVSESEAIMRRYDRALGVKD